MKKILKIGGYVRVSHEEQKKFGYSTKAQIEEIEKWCNENNHNLIDLYIDEGYSASNMKRPNLQRMINDLPKLDAILLTRLDRLSRNVLEANKLLQLLKQNNTDMIAIKEENVDTTTSNGMFLFNLKLSLAQHELDRGSERIKAVFEYKVREGEAVTGSLPFGYKIGKKDGKKVIIKDKETEAIVNDIFDHFSTYRSIRSTCIYINKKYNLTKDYRTYARILKRDLYTGRYKDNYNYAPAYITEEKYLLNQKYIKDNVKVRKNKNVYLFVGMIKCPECKSSFVGKYYDGKKRYYSYVCGKHKSTKLCSFKKGITEEKIETFLIENVEDLLNKHIASVRTDVEILPKPEKEKLKKQIKDIKTELDNLNYMFRKGRISASDYDIEYDDLEKELKKIEALTTSNKEIKDINKFFVNDWKTIYNNLEKEKKRALWNSVIKNITIDEDLNITLVFRS